MHWVALRTGTPKDRNEVNRREVCECVSDSPVSPNRHFIEGGSSSSHALHMDSWANDEGSPRQKPKSTRVFGTILYRNV